MYTDLVHIILLEMLLAFVELQQLLLPLLLKFDIIKCCAGAAAAAAVVRHPAQDGVHLCCGLLQLSSMICMKIFLGSGVACTDSI